MEPISTSIITYVSLKFLDQFLKEEGYNRIKNWLFPKKRYGNRLTKIIFETIEEHEKAFPFKGGQKFPFYHSQILFEELNKHVLFKTKYQDEEIVKELSKNPNILIPSSDELSSFYSKFVNKINHDENLKNLFIDENYKSKIFEISESIKNIEEKIKAIEQHLLFNPTNEWFVKQCQSSIFDLGCRYSPELNFELDISNIFEGIGRTERFKVDITKRFDHLIIKGKKVLKRQEETSEKIERLQKYFDDLCSLFNDYNFLGTAVLNFDSFNDLLNNAQIINNELHDFYLEEEGKLQKEKKDYQFYHRYGYELRNSREFDQELSNFIHFLNSPTFKLANNPLLVLDGEAGIGKSHLLGDVITRRTRSGYKSVFLLGQHFSTEEDPWTQIFKRLQINSQKDDFLQKLNENGERSGKRVIIFIDALNEGRGRYFWPQFINSFIKDFESYPWLGLVLTIRSSYKKLVISDIDKSDLEFVEHTMYGFRNVEYEASKLFFENYKIELPNVPLLHPEFQNPLFLKLFCEGIHKSGLTLIPDGLQGITSIINFFINSVNNSLSKPSRVSYSISINLVKKSIDALIQYKVDNQERYVSYEKAYEIIDNAVSKFISFKGFIDELITEGVLSKNLFWRANHEPEEGVYIAYERFEDHLTSLYLLDKYSNFEKEFKEDGNLYKYVKDEHTVYMNRGLVDAFSIQIPEKSGKELFECVPYLDEKYPIIESFVESLLWRKIETINEKSLDFVNEYVLHFQGTHNLFWETVLAVSAIPDHFFNAYRLHSFLMHFSIADRDAFWTQFLKYRFDNDSSVKRLIDWAWNETEKSHISDESIKLSSIALAWFHTATNRRLRDSSTKALVCLLQDRLDVLIEVLTMFEGVNDPYVYERLFAVAYGCALRTNQRDNLSELSEYIFKTIFNDKQEVYPHALLRDYARNIIEFTDFMGYSLSFDLKLINPPYKSSFPEKFMTNDEIDAKYKFDYKAADYKKIYWPQNAILNSMTTEYGRGTGGYGDFGRYTFESALRSWKINTNQLSNIAIEWIFEKYGYDIHKHAEYDSSIESFDRGPSLIERIGKKYQWIALFEMVARVSDNFKKYDEWSYREDKEEPFQGTWDPYIRDIDPTMIISKTGNYDEEELDKNWWTILYNSSWECSNKDWLRRTEDLQEFGNQIQVNDHNSEEWLILEGYPEWAEPKKIGEEKWDYPHKRIWCQIRSYIVKDSEFDKFKVWACRQDYMGRWMPESHDRYEIFSREYYWSPAHRYFMTEDYDGKIWRDVYDPETRIYVSEVIVPTESFLWEEQYDYSKEGVISFLKPCLTIFEGMRLKYSRKEGEFLNYSDEPVCFATNIFYKSKPYLLIKKAPFLKYLKENGLNIVWTLLGEKQIIGGGTTGADFPGRLEISGAYYFDDQHLQGNLNFKYI